MRETEKLFTPFGVDHITFACYDRHFWQRVFERFGFVTLPAKYEAFVDHRTIVAMRHGDVRIILADPTSVNLRYASDPFAHGEDIAWFLAEHGDMQIFSAVIRVDDVFQARRELWAPSILEKANDDPFGLGIKLQLKCPFQSAVRWELIQRLDERVFEGEEWKSIGVDHFAIGVRNLEQWVEFYHSLGFETIYAPSHDKIKGEYSGMKTVAVQRGGWVVALVEGVDKEMPSQVTNYVSAHGDHAIQHAALRFTDLAATVKKFARRGVQLRSRRRPEDLKGDLSDVIHEGEDHSGPLYQCFTKPFARRPNPENPEAMKGGFFFELIQRIGQAEKVKEGKQAFHDPTVIGLYRSIEEEEVAEDSGLVFSDELMEGYRFQEWLAENQKAQKE